jgi:hypothetical protein
MAGRDFEADFDEIMVGLAQEDVDLVATIKDNLASDDEDETRLTLRDTQLGAELRLHYLLSDDMYGRAVGQCVSRLISDRLGIEVFGE